jgi:hypothetical protein
MKKILYLLLFISTVCYSQPQALFFSHNVQTAASYDADAQAFFDVNTGLTTTQKSAVNQLVLDFKTAAIWTKMKAIYPFVGGTASADKWNLKDPRDLDAAFRLTFPNGATHSANGVDWNGTNQYANTFLVPSAALSSNNTHLSYYSRENTSEAACEVGGYNTSSSDLFAMYVSYSGTGISDQYSASSGRLSVTVANSSGFFLTSRTSSLSHAFYRNGSSLGSSSTSGGALPTYSVFIAARNASGSASLFTTRQCAFASIGDGLTSTEASAMYTAVQTFETTLGRQL